MDLDARLKLSYYREIAAVSETHPVKLVQHTETGKVYVLKALRIYDLSVYEFLMKEKIPGTPHIHELIEADGILYVAEEYISGRSLREMADSGYVFREDEVTDYIKRLCKILCVLHEQTPPIVHRDIKPENILLDERGNLYLVDFNSAKECDGSKSQDTVLLGTAGYAAPEQYGFGASTPSADVYGLGVLMNVLLTGDCPAKAVVSGRLAPVVERCTRMEPTERYGSADELLKALRGREKKGVGQSWLPPGLSSEKSWVAVLSALWYAAVLFLSASLYVEDASPAETWINRVFCFLLFISETLWVGNYRGIRGHFSPEKRENILIRILAVAMGCVFIFVLIMSVLTIFA